MTFADQRKHCSLVTVRPSVWEWERVTDLDRHMRELEGSWIEMPIRGPAENEALNTVTAAALARVRARCRAPALASPWRLFTGSHHMEWTHCLR